MQFPEPNPRLPSAPNPQNASQIDVPRGKRVASEARGLYSSGTCGFRAVPPYQDENAAFFWVSLGTTERVMMSAIARTKRAYGIRGSTSCLRGGFPPVLFRAVAVLGLFAGGDGGSESLARRFEPDALCTVWAICRGCSWASMGERSAIYHEERH